MGSAHGSPRWHPRALCLFSMCHLWFWLAQTTPLLGAEASAFPVDAISSSGHHVRILVRDHHKFTVVASQFIAVVLMLTYEPDGFCPRTSASYTGPRTNKIWDISEDTTFEFEVPWMAPIAMLVTGMPGVARYAIDPTSTLLDGFNSVWAPNPGIPQDFNIRIPCIMGQSPYQC